MLNLVRILIKNGIISLILLTISTQLLAQDQNITIDRTVNSDQSIDLKYDKKLPGSYYVVLELSNVINCDTDKFKGVISGYSGNLLKLKPSNPNKGIGYSMRFTSVMGVPNPKIDSLFQYTLPFKNGNKVKIGEAGFLGEKYFGSEKPANWKSYVVFFKTPDTVYSMRKGIVVKITNDYNDDSSITKHFTSKRNSVTIEHADGTFAEYKGFKKNSFKVKLGQTVYPHTQLGTIEVFNESEHNYRFDFSIFYLNDVEFTDTDVKQTMKNVKHRYKYLTPQFLTPEGIITVESKKEYTALFNESQLFQELSRSEKKKYTKDPSQFK